MLNKVILMGRLTADPELRRTQSELAVCSFSIAVDRDFKNKSTGDKETDFVNIVTWRQTAEFVSRYLGKGRMVVVEGRLQIRKYTDREGNNRTAAEVVAENVYFADSKWDGDGGGPTARGGYDRGGQSAPRKAPPKSDALPFDLGDGDAYADLDIDDVELPY
jgi:single-strand DNA-binding protein